MSGMTPGQMVTNFIRLRDHKKAAEVEFKKSMAKVVEGMEKLEAMMLDHINTSGTKNISAEIGTAYIIKRTNATVKDREVFLKWLNESGEWDALDVKANKGYLKEHPEPIPGVKVSSLNQIGVRR
jgi:hypothetical protein